MKRALAYAATLWLAITLNFLLPRWMPGDPLALIAGEAVRQMNAEQIAALRHAHGLDKPLVEQYFIYLSNLLRGDLGSSYRYSGGQSVIQILANRLGWTLFLILPSLTLATLIGSALGVWAANRRHRGGDLGIVALLFTLRSIPSFWLAMILIPIFAVGWRIFPSGDSYSFPRPTGIAFYTDVLRHAAMPIAVLTFAYIPYMFAIMRSSILGVFSSAYMLTAQAKGLSSRRILYVHALRNALLPILTAVGLEFGQLLGGVTLIETVFNYRGVGAMMFEAVKSRDYPLLQGGFLLFTVGVLAVNLALELIYRRIDPRLAAPNHG
jgi:peptide/nickel transport system permease protein